MARIPYADLDDDEIRPLVDQITEQRGSVLHLYQMLLHSPPVAQGWLTYLTAIRQNTTINGALRELVIVRIAQINGAAYEADQHIPIALQEGVTQDQLDHLDDWQSATCFSEMERRVLALTEEMTRNVQVPAAVIDALKQEFSHRELVELIATIGAYNMVSRFLEALTIDSADQISQ